MAIPMPLKDACLSAIGSRLVVDLHKMIGNLRRERMLVTQSTTYRIRCQISSVSLMYGTHRVDSGRTPGVSGTATTDANKNSLAISLSLSLSPSPLWKQVITLSLYSISREWERHEITFEIHARPARYCKHADTSPGVNVADTYRRAAINYSVD